MPREECVNPPAPHVVPAPAHDDAFIAADIGGTHARIGLVRGTGSAASQVDVLAYARYRCADYGSLAAILRHFLDDHVAAPVARATLACAGCAVDDTVVNANLPWPVNLRDLRAELPLGQLSLINDFEALAHATRLLRPEQTTLLTPDAVAGDGPVVVVGPGTGLGSAVYLPDPRTPRVLASEAGQIDLAATDAGEDRVLARLRGNERYVSYEQVLSGPGLLRLYRTLCALDHAAPALDRPERVSAAALAGSDARAVRALDMFCAWLGGFAGNLAMLYGASGGVYLAGGVLPHVATYLPQTDFLARFLDKGGMRAFLERVPVRLMDHGQLGVIGAAGWYLQREAAKREGTDERRGDA